MSASLFRSLPSVSSQLRRFAYRTPASFPFQMAHNLGGQSGKRKSDRKVRKRKKREERKEKKQKKRKKREERKEEKGRNKILSVQVLAGSSYPSRGSYVYVRESGGRRRFILPTRRFRVIPWGRESGVRWGRLYELAGRYRVASLEWWQGYPLRLKYLSLWRYLHLFGGHDPVRRLARRLGYKPSSDMPLEEMLLILLHLLGHPLGELVVQKKSE